MISLRPYQQEAVDATFSEWTRVSSTAVILPTGAGKTRMAAEVIRRVCATGKRAMFLAHREELVQQAAKTISGLTNLEVGIEMGESHIYGDLFKPPVVISSVQSMNADRGDHKRMGYFDFKEFGVLVLDELHHSVAATWKNVIRYMRLNPHLKILGITATPRRADNESLGQVIDSVAYDYAILDAIDDGWLLDVDQQVVSIRSLDFSHIPTVAGDLSGPELAEVMEAEKNLYGVADAVMQVIGDKRAIAFASSVRHAAMLSELFNRYQPGIAGWASGATPKEERAELMNRFRSGKLQILSNCDLYGEGLDVPEARLLIMAKPTKSLTKYTQMLGRVMRPLPGVVDGFSTAKERRAAIMDSQKPCAEVMDFAGNAGRHKLITVADVLGGRVSEEAIEGAKKLAAKLGKKGQAVHMSELLVEEEDRLKKEYERRKAEEAAKRAQLTARVQFSTYKVDPFDAWQMSPVQERGWDAGRQLSYSERGLLLKIGIDPDTVTYAQGRKIYVEQLRRWRAKLCTMKQAELLKGFYPTLDTKNLKLAEASRMIDALKANNWKP